MLLKTGKKVWERQIDCYGRLRTGDNKFVPFLYSEQYVDVETGLAYNRFRYYDVESGKYLSQDPIGLDGGTNLYDYVNDVNSDFDEFRLIPRRKNNGQFAKKPGPKPKPETFDSRKFKYFN